MKSNIIECYSCCQGEGSLAGVPHILVRFAGCTLRCKWCDTPYSSHKPSRDFLDMDVVYDKLRESRNIINHVMITGGAPTIHEEELVQLVNFCKELQYHVTIETEGSSFVKTRADLISLSPKFKSSSPDPSDRYFALHEKMRTNYQAMGQMIDSHSDYIIKPVISNEEDLRELDLLQDLLSIPNSHIWLMPEGRTPEEIQKNSLWLMPICIEKGYNYSPRLQVMIYGNKRYV